MSKTSRLAPPSPIVISAPRSTRISTRALMRSGGVVTPGLYHGKVKFGLMKTRVPEVIFFNRPTASMAWDKTLLSMAVQLVI